MAQGCAVIEFLFRQAEQALPTRSDERGHA
jgi:hypothetical protein